MIDLSRFFRHCGNPSLKTQFARQRMANSMPGEAGALASLRLAGYAL